MPRLFRVALTATLALVVLSSGRLLTQEPGTRAWRTVLVDGREAIEGEVLVRFRTPPGGFEEARAAADVETAESETIARNGLRRWRARRLGTRALIARLRANPDVEFVEPNYIIRIDAVPNDPSFANLWGLFNSGQNIGGAGIAGADIDAPLAWDISTGSRDKVVGVIDTGIDYTHPDLAANIWSAPTAFSVTVGGLVINCAAGTHGFNAINNTCNPMDDHSHGTHVSGTIGGVGNNGTGVVGVNWVASIMGLKFLGSSGSGSTSDAVKAIDFAIQTKTFFGSTGGAADVRVLSNSWGGGGFSQSLLDAINRANTANMLFVAAAGNDALNNDVYPNYPSNYSAPNVLAVAATTNRDQRSSFSNYGAVTVDLGAPGSSILSTTPNNTYSYFNGTSMATPHVSGAAALLLSACTLTTAELKSALMTGVDLVPAMSGITVTGGRLNVNNAIRVCPPLSNAVPVVTSLSPSTAYANLAFTLSVDGRGFARTSQIRIDGTARTTTYISSTRLQTSIAAGEFPSVGPRSISVISPTPGGGTSGSLTLTLTPPPTMTINGSTSPLSVLPSAPLTVAVAGGPANRTDWVTIVPVGSSSTTYTGIWFLSGNSIPPVAGVSAASFVIPAPTTDGTYEVRFLADGHWDRLATSSVITVASPRVAPGIDSISPNALVQSHPEADIAVYGIFHSASSQVLFDGVARPTRLPSAGPGLLVTLSSSDLNSVGTHAITVRTPAPGGGTSNSVPFTVFPMPGNPMLTSISPTAIGAGTSGATLTVTGTGFALNSKVVVGAAARATTFVSSTQLTTILQSGDLASPGTLSISVLTPAPGGGVSSALSLSVLGPTISVNGSSGALAVGAGSSLMISVANGPGSRTDWVTIAPVGSSATTYTGIWFLSGTSLPPSAGMTSASFAIPAPAADGNYEVRFLADGHWDRLATSGVITVSVPRPVPQLSAISPAGVVEGSSSATVVLSGSAFHANSQVLFDGAARPTTFNSSNQLTVTLAAGDLAAVAAHTLRVNTPAPGGGASGSIAFNVFAVPAAPILTSISPATAPVGSAVTLTLTGSAFAASSRVLVEGTPRPTTFVSSTSLRVAIPASDLTAIGTRSIMVLTPAPGGGVSSAQTLTLIGPNLTVNGSSGAVAAAAGAVLTIAVSNGPASRTDWVTIVPVGSGPNTYTGIWFLSGTSIPPDSGMTSATFAIRAPATDGDYEVRFLADGHWDRLATSGVISVSAPRPVPQLSSIAPAGTVEGSSSATVVLSGSGFHAGSQVLFDGAARPTTFNSANQLSVTLSSGDLAAVATHTISVTTPAPGGGNSSGVTFTVFAVPPSPVITAISPTTAGMGSAGLTVTVTGTAFAANSRVVVDATPRPTTYVSATTLRVAIPAVDLTTLGTRGISVLTPAPGGGVSSSLPLTVIGPTLSVNGSFGAVAAAANSSLVIAVANGPANRTDWVTIAPVGSGPNTYSGIWFLSGTSMPPDAGLTAATFALRAPATDGDYEVRFLADGHWDRLATSGVITVSAPRPVPQLATIAPAGIVEGSPSATVVLNGSGFHATSQVLFDGVARPTTFNSVNRLTVTLSSGDLMAIAAHTLSVTTPGPGGGTTGGATFNVFAVPPVPILTSISPTSVAAGTQGLTLTVNGSAFAANSQVVVEGTVRPTTFVSSTVLRVAIPANELTAIGSRSIMVLTSAPGGGASSSASLSVLGPSITVNGISGAITVARGSSLAIAVANGPANRTDWVTIVPVGSGTTTYTGIWFLSGTSMPPDSGVATANFSIAAPLTPGSYEVRFHADGHWDRLATSGVITVTP